MTATDAAPRIERGGIGDLADVMIAMQDAFDPVFGEAWTEAQCAGVLGMPGAHLILARCGGEPAGFALLRTIAGETELLLIAVRAGFRRRGIGTALLARALAAARTDGADAMHLEVRDGNDAVRLYQAAGFLPVGRRRHYYRGRDGKAFDALTFRRDMAAG